MKLFNEQLNQKNEKIERIKEIDNYVKEYFQKYKVGYEASGIGNTQGTDLAWTFWSGLNESYNEEINNILKEKLTGENLVDLGVGKNWSNVPLLKIPLASYSAVDIKLPSQTMLENRGILKNFEDLGTKTNFVESDMLSYVAHLPDNSSNFFMSAIDDDVILDEKYWKYLVQELVRTTKNGGIIIDGGVGEIGYYLEEFAKDKFSTIFDEGRGQKKVFEKIKS